MLTPEDREMLSRRVADRLAQAAGPVREAGRTGHLPLSSGQWRLWFIDRLDPGNVAYNTSVAYRLRGRLDVRALAGALAAVVRRYEVLRTTYPVVDGAPVQSVADPCTVPELEVSDVSGVEDGPEAVRKIALAASETPFDLATGPLVRTGLIRIADDDHVLSFVAHHSVFDGQSLAVWADEVSAGYRAAGRQGTPPTPPPAQYADFVRWQSGVTAGPAGIAHARYWRTRLAGAPAVLEIAADRQRPGRPTYRAGVVDAAIPAHLVARLRALATANGATLFMVTLAAYQAVLARHSGATDVVVGCPVDVRSRPEFKSLIGMFVNTLPMRASLAGDPRFAQLLAQVRDGTLADYEHAEFPFERIVDELAPPRDLGRNPLVQVWFNMMPRGSAGEFGALRLPGVHAAFYQTGKARTRFDLELHLTGSADGGYALRLLYASDLFQGPSMQRFTQHYLNFLTGIADAADSRLSRVPIFTVDERAQILHTWATADQTRR